MRVLSLCPSNTELMAYLGQTSLLAGVDDFSDWPREIGTLPRLGPDLSINLDLVEELKPDLVLASLSVPGMEKNVEGLKARQIPHLVLNPQSLGDIELDLIRTAEALGMPEAGQKAAMDFRKRLEAVSRRKQSSESTPSLYWEWWPKPVFTPGKGNWLTEISEAAGARNVYGDVEVASVQTDWDDVLKHQPDFICLAWVGVQRQKISPSLIMKRPGWKNLEAVKKGRIFILEEELYCRPSPRLLDGLEKLCKLLDQAK